MTTMRIWRNNLDYNGLEYLQFRNYVYQLIAKGVVYESDPLWKVLEKARSHDEKHMVSDNDLSGKNNHEYNKDDS